MARRSSFSSALAKSRREAEKRANAYHRAQEKAAKDLERSRIAQAKASAQLAKAQEKEKAKLYTESRIADVELQNAELADTIEQLETILKATLSVDDYLDLETLKEKPEYPAFYAPLNLTTPAAKPDLDKYLPPDPTGFKKLIPGTAKKHQEALYEAKAVYDADMAKYNQYESKRKAFLEEVKHDYEERILALKQKTAEQHAEIDKFKNELETAQPEAIMNYCTLVLETSIYPEDFPQRAKIAYVPESKQLVIEYDLPTLDAVPEVSVYKYNKSKDEVSSTARPATQRKALYASIVAQITIRTIHELLEADRLKHLETIVFNGYVETVDKGTGRDLRTCLVTVRTSRDIFQNLDLRRVDPEACLKTLNATVSKSPSELAPVRPVLEFSMVDHRFVEETDVISTLDQRTNLMELTPNEFESLITNLFKKMGLESRLTQASRDGGVDCVAFDPRPIFGGKVIIQAKRYKHTVGVSAVRDLFGTLQNEGASKGILVTTSGYGKAAFEFAEGKPLELLSGSNLLYLLKEHAGVDAKIEVPTAWKDASLDVEEAQI